jgi:hypothetical protein
MGKILYVNWHTRTFDPRPIEDQGTKQGNIPPLPQPKPAVPAKPRKEPIIISVMPEQAFPIGHQDLRPLLQRDGLILLSWALWEDWNGGGNLLQRYIVTWVATGRRSMRYATCAIPGKELEKANPERRADAFFYKGIYGNYWWATSNYLTDDRVADYLYLVAPFDLDGKTIPGYIQVLKARGSTVDFDYEFTLTKTLKSNAQVYLEKITASK